MTTTFPKDVPPNDEALAIPNLIPGAEMLGYGFNIFKDYSFDASIQPLLKLGAPRSWSSSKNVTYNVPEYVTTPGGSKATALAKTFDSASEFSSYFQSSASVSGSVGAFSTSFSTAYGSERKDTYSTSWAMVEADFHQWSLRLRERNVLDSVAADPDWANLPDTFDAHNADNVLKFYQFFRRFGTHFISRVSAGGTLYYYISVQKSSHYTSEQVEQNAMAEYQGLISSSRVEASRKWGSTSSNWTESRQSHAVVVPGTSAVVEWVNPAKDSYDEHHNFEAWQTEVTERPSRTTFALTPVWDLFSGSKWRAVQDAYASYANTRISVQAWKSNNDTILINGVPVFAPGAPIDRDGGGWHLVLLDAKSLKPVLNKNYIFSRASRTWPDDTYATMANDLQPYAGNPAYMLIAATSWADMGESPNTQAYAILRSFGAGDELQKWYSNQQHACAAGPASATYALIGLGGAAEGLETFVNDSTVTPIAQLSAFLLPGKDGFTPKGYTS